MTIPQPYRVAGELELGREVATFRRTPGQNAGAGCLALFFFALPLGMALVAHSPGGYLLAAVGALAACLPTALIARQVVPNWNVRWALHERGFTRERRGRRERFAYGDVSAVCIRPVREAMVYLQDGRALLIEGLAGSDQLAAALEQAVSHAALARYAATLRTGGEVALGRLAIGPSGVRVDDTWFDWRELRTESVRSPGAMGVEGTETWVFTSVDATRRAEVPLTAVPLPTVARTLIAEGIERSGQTVSAPSR